MTASPYDEPLSELREAVESIGPWLGIWEHRTEPDAFARRCAAGVVDAIDAALGELYRIRGQLTAEVRQAYDATAARADELLRRSTPIATAERPAGCGWRGALPCLHKRQAGRLIG